MKLIRKFRPFGLKWRRQIEWIKDVAAEKPGLGELVHMLLMSFKAAFTPVNKSIYKQRLLICRHCPIYNKVRKSCRNGEDGCGCYVPYKALAPVACWDEERNSFAGWGRISLTSK